MTLDKELKEAISRLPSKEKDKLIFRLLKKDESLAKRIYFELVSGDTVEFCREKAKKNIDWQIEQSRKYANYMSPGIILMDMRQTVGYVNDHVKTTKDKYGEVALMLHIVKAFLKIYRDNFQNRYNNKGYTLHIYFIAKLFKILILLRKMNEDYMIDFIDDLEQIGRTMGEIPNLMQVAIHNEFNPNWLFDNQIPENIAEIEKNLRKRGYLK
ncbi:MAG: hypothetical protein LBB41_06270 [Prevotellaceae bacterium]|jgi:hypothetical protein|nr:hypothetical protein [Prevotellaceae bacterium]